MSIRNPNLPSIHRSALTAMQVTVSATLVVSTFALLAPTTNAQSINVNLEAVVQASKLDIPSQPNFPTVYFFQPVISLSEQGVPSAATATFSSPIGGFYSFTYEPGAPVNFGGTSVGSAATMLGHVRGTWDLSLEQAGSTYEYEVDVDWTLPFAQLPRFSSTTLLDGEPADEFTWSVIGGSPQFPGPSSEIAINLAFLNPDFGGFFQTLENVVLPGNATSWVPTGDLLSHPEYSVTMATQNEAIDTSSLTVTGIRSLTPNAPMLDFAAPSVRYTASYVVRLSPATAVPEPSSVALACLLLAGGFAARRRR